MSEPDWQGEADAMNAEHDPFADDDAADARQELEDAWWRSPAGLAEVARINGPTPPPPDAVAGGA